MRTPKDKTFPPKNSSSQGGPVVTDYKDKWYERFLGIQELYPTTTWEDYQEFMKLLGFNFTTDPGTALTLTNLIANFLSKATHSPRKAPLTSFRYIHTP